MEHVAPIISSLASLLWVIFAFSALFMFRSEIISFANRFRKGRLFGQELELSEDLQKLESAAKAAAEEVSGSEIKYSEKENNDSYKYLSSQINLIIELAASSPKAALLQLRGELEKAIWNAVAIRGLAKGRSDIPASRALQELVQYGFPKNMVGSIERFFEVHNKIMHGRGATDDEVLQAIDSGLTIIKALQMLPGETNVVYHPGVDIFSDSACQHRYDIGRGVILETTSPGGARKSFRIFPTTRTHFEKGKQVAWEWSMDRKWGEAWYRDPDNSEIKLAWSSSAEFIGRNIEK